MNVLSCSIQLIFFQDLDRCSQWVRQYIQPTMLAPWVVRLDTPRWGNSKRTIMRSRLTRHSNKICALSHWCTTPYANCYIYGYMVIEANCRCWSFGRTWPAYRIPGFPGRSLLLIGRRRRNCSWRWACGFIVGRRWGVFFLVIIILSGWVSFHILNYTPFSIIYHCCSLHLAAFTTISIHRQSELYAITLTPRPHPTTKQGRHTFWTKNNNRNTNLPDSTVLIVSSARGESEGYARHSASNYDTTASVLRLSKGHPKIESQQKSWIMTWTSNTHCLLATSEIG